MKQTKISYNQIHKQGEFVMGKKIKELDLEKLQVFKGGVVSTNTIIIPTEKG